MLCCQAPPPHQVEADDLEKKNDSLRVLLAELVHLDRTPNQDMQSKIEKIEDGSGYELYRVLLFRNGKDTLPMFLLKPTKLPPPFRVMICLQGHAPGMYISIGETRSDRDVKLVEGGRDLAIQAVNHGWAALTVEQLGFGELTDSDKSCNHLSLNLFLSGETMVGKRVANISAAIDFLETQPDLTMDDLSCIGNSAGGTSSFFAACLDQRIKLAIVSCSFCTYEKSWLKYPHCSCGYIPGLLDLADMPELTQLIAPRHLLIVAGIEDYLADIDGVREGFEIAQNIYTKAAAVDNIMLLEGNGGHQFYSDLAWPVIDRFSNEKEFK